MVGRVFAYCRVSTGEQTADNQAHAIRAAGYDIEPHRVISETVSGSRQAMKRPGFKALVDHKLEPGDTLVVLKLDRLGRDNIDVQQTITQLIEKDIKVVSLDLPTSDLSSSEGRLLLQMFAAFAEFERNRICERTREGLERAKQEGKRLGRPSSAHKTIEAVAKARADRLSQKDAADRIGCSLRTVKRYWKKSLANQEPG